MKSGLVLLFVIIICLVGVIFLGSMPLSASDEEVVAEGKAQIEKPYLASNPKNSDNPFIDFKIIKKHGEYFWASNNNKPLIRIEKKSTLLNKHPQTVFLNPDGDGIIIIIHEESSVDRAMPCHDLPVANYREYRANERGGLTPYSGHTKSYPFPKPHDPNRCW